MGTARARTMFLRPQVDWLRAAARLKAAGKGKARMKQAMVIVPLIAALAGCQSESRVEADNATVGEVANQVADVAANDKQSIRPGLWSSTMTIEEIDAPGIPAEIVRRMKDATGSGKTHQGCLTEEQARKPGAGFFTGTGDQCRYDHFTMGGGKIDATMRCSQQGVSQVMQLKGTYSPESYQMRMSAHMEGAGPVGGMTMTMRVDAKRIGQCTAKTI
jgi:hypothetical protein